MGRERGPAEDLASDLRCGTLAPPPLINAGTLAPSMVGLRPMTESEFPPFRDRLIREYARASVRVGVWRPAESDDAARAEIDEMTPQGPNTPGQYLCTIVNDLTGSRIGEAWYFLEPLRGRSQLFVQWLGIDEPHRGKGYGTAAFLQLEKEAARLGASRIEFHVFGDNVRALSLYERLGYYPTSVMVAKDLGRGPPTPP